MPIVSVTENVAPFVHTPEDNVSQILLPCDWPEASCNVASVIVMIGHRPFLM